MKKILCFILGIVSYVSIIPILESVTEVVCGKMEVAKGKATKEILTINAEIEELQEKLQPVQTQAIGFECPSEPYYEDDEWEDDKLNNRIGY